MACAYCTPECIAEGDVLISQTSVPLGHCMGGHSCVLFLCHFVLLHVWWRYWKNRLLWQVVHDALMLSVWIWPYFADSLLQQVCKVCVEERLQRWTAFSPELFYSYSLFSPANITFTCNEVGCWVEWKDKITYEKSHNELHWQNKVIS